MSIKPMEPDFSKKKFEIIITVYENCQTFEVKSLEEGFHPSYCEIVGALEIQKSMLMYDQSTYNCKIARSKKIKP
jgi:hypothetical protein